MLCSFHWKGERLNTKIVDFFQSPQTVVIKLIKKGKITILFFEKLKKKLKKKRIDSVTYSVFLLIQWNGH